MVSRLVLIILAIVGISAVIAVTQKDLIQTMAMTCNQANIHVKIGNKVCNYEYQGMGKGVYEWTEIEQKQKISTTDVKDVQPQQQLFTNELFNGDVNLPYSTGVHTSNSRSLQISVDGDSRVKVSIEGSNCIIEGVTFDKVCEVEPNTDIIVKVEGTGQTHLILKSSLF